MGDPGECVGPDQEDRPGQGRERQQDAVFRADQEPYAMRNDQTDEPPILTAVSREPANSSTPAPKRASFLVRDTERLQSLRDQPQRVGAAHGRVELDARHLDDPVLPHSGQL